jgi:hypothetical protein
MRRKSSQENCGKKISGGAAISRESSKALSIMRAWELCRDTF